MRCFTPTRKIWRSRWSCGVLDWMVSCSLVPVPCLQSSQFLSSGPGWYKLTSKTWSIGIAFGFLCSSKINVLTHSPEPKGFDAEHDSNPFKWPPFLFTHPCFSENTKEICCIALCSLDVCPGSPLPFPLPKGWTRAGYHPLLRGEFMQKKMESCTGFCSKRACAASCSGFSFFRKPTWKSEMHLKWFILGCVGSYRKPYSHLLPVMLGHINIWLGPSDHFWLLTRDHSVVRWAPKNSKKTINVETLRRKNGTDLVSKPIIWIWSCALTSFLLPHSSEHRSRKPLERSILGIRWKSQGCIYLCSANAMTWAPERTKDLEWNFQKPFRRESWFFTATRFPPQNGYANAFCSDPHWLLIHHRNPQSIL